MSPGRAWSALTISRLFLPASALRTHVCTAAQPVPSILTPAFSSDHVTKLAHHGLPGPTFAAARYSSTSLPVFVPASCTPSWVCATFSAAVPALLPPAPGAAAAVASTMPGTDAGAAIALAGPAGGWGARKKPEAPFLPALEAWAAAAMNWPDWPFLGSGATAAAAAGAPGAGGAAATAAAARRAGHRGRGRSDRSRLRAAGGDVGGRRPALVDLLLEADVHVVLVAGVGEVAGPADRPRRADLVRAVLLRQRRELAGELTRGGGAGVDDLAVDRGDVEPAAVGVVGDRATRRELRVVRAHARDLQLVVLGELGQDRHHARVDLARLEVRDPDGVELEVLVLEQRRALG